MRGAGAAVDAAAAPLGARGAPVLAARAVTVRRGSSTLLDGVDVTVRAGEHWALLGGNGAGKTTLLSLLGARVHPTSGSVEVLGQPLGRVAVQDLWPRIGQVPSGHVPAGRLSCRQVVLSGATSTAALPLRRVPSPDRLARVDAWPSTRGPPCRQGSGPARWWPARWSAIRRCCSSTSPRPGSTCPPASGWSPPWRSSRPPVRSGRRCW